MKIYLLFFSFLLSANLYAEKEKTIIINYTSFDGLQVVGKLYLPERKKVDKLVINLNARRSESISPLSGKDSILHTHLRNKFLKNGIAYYQYFFPEVDNAESEVDWGLSVYSRDADDAISILKDLDQIKHTQIGLMGCSELGCSGAVCASKNEDVKFFVSTTSVMIKGYMDTLYRKSGEVLSKIEAYKMLLDRVLEDSVFIYKGEVYPKNKDIFEKCFYATVDSVVKSIYNYGKYDSSILQRASRTIKELWKGSRFNTEIAVGEVNNYDMVVDSIICKFMFSKPNVIHLYQWNPELYYPLIEIPTYISVGGKDRQINPFDNYSGALYLKEKYDKSNFTIEFFEDLDHNLSQGPKEQEISFKDKNNKNRTYIVGSFIMDDRAIDRIVEWINKIQ